MNRKIRYLSHPQVKIDPQIDVPAWSLNDTGRQRVARLCRAKALSGTRYIISSDEQKAIETGQPLARAFGCAFEIRAGMHENDRSATGFLPPEEFEQVADQFFANPDTSIHGWETARAAQQRIVFHFNACLQAFPKGDILFTGHGGVGTLLYCHLSNRPISRAFDQIPGGGCFWEFSAPYPQKIHHWRPMETLLEDGFDEPA